MRVLVAEKQKVVRRLIVSYLEKLSCTILKVGDSSGLEVLLEESADLLILDISLISDSLTSFIHRLHERHPTLYILLTSYKEFYPPPPEILREKYIEYLPKPFTEKDLENFIEKIFSQIQGNEKTLSDFSHFLEIESLPSVQNHPAMKKAIGFLHNVAESDITVLIAGESGVGKEVFAQRLHSLSKRREHPFVGINCASIPASLLEAELFGSERGAFTGSVSKRIGKFELAQEGTLLLDEISEMDLALQSKLLRVIQEKELYRVGGNDKIKLNVRIVATTNRDLKEAVRSKFFREDLYYRLNVISIRIPPLRERLEDIPLLAGHILHRFHEQYPEKKLSLSEKATQQMMKYSWPGNIRELENILIRTAYLTQTDTIETLHFDETDSTSITPQERSSSSLVNIREMERELIERALEMHQGNRVRAANTLGISVRTLRNKLKIYREEASIN